MRAYQLPKGGAGIDALVKVERPDPKPAYRQVVVKVKACSLNFRDLRLLSRRRSTSHRGRTDMRLEEHFESSSTLQRNERVKLAASFWNNVGAGMVIGGMAGAFFLDKPSGTWAKIGIAIAGLALGWLCYSIASNILTYLYEERARAAGV